MAERFNYIMNDITSQCNLRCPFCINDWKTIGKNVNMSKEMCAKALSLSELTGSFFFSCAYEITIHPNFIELLEMITPEQGKKMFFTTNLSNKLTDDQIERMSLSNVNNINVSIESLNKDKYEYFRQNASHDIFLDNLDRLSKAVKRNKKVKLHFITMIFKSNIQEIPTLIKRCKKEYDASFHEFRVPFDFSLNYMNDEFKTKELINEEEFNTLYKELNKTGCEFRMCDFDNKIEKHNESPDNILARDMTNFLKIESDGRVIINNKDCYDLNNIEHPVDFFRRILKNEFTYFEVKTLQYCRSWPFNYKPAYLYFLNEKEINILQKWFNETDDKQYVGETDQSALAFISSLIMGNDNIRNIVQLGTYTGLTSYISGIALKNKQQGKFHTIDIDEEKLKFTKKFIKEFELEDYINTYLFSTIEKNKVDEYFKNNSIDMLFIDSWHKYEQTIKELNIWYNKVKKSGIILFHDASINISNGEVNKAIKEFCNKHNTNFVILEPPIYGNPCGLGMIVKQ